MTYLYLAKDIGSPLMHSAAYGVAEGSPKLKKYLGILHQSYVVYHDRQLSFVFDDKHFHHECKRVNQILSTKKGFKQMKKSSLETIKALRDEVLKLQGKDFSLLAPEEIDRLFRKLFALWVEMNYWGHIVNLVDFHFNILSNNIIQALEKIKKAGQKFSVGKAFSQLTPMKKFSLVQLEEIELFEIMAKIQSKPKALKLFKQKPEKILAGLGQFPSINKSIREHKRKYDWLQFHYDGPKILDESYFVEMLHHAIKQGFKGKKKVADIKKKHNQALQAKEKLIKKLGAGKQLKHLLDVAQESIYLKALRKETAFQASRLTHPLICEVAKRLALSPTQVRHMKIEEILPALKKNQANTALLNERISASVWFNQKGKLVVKSGKQAEKLLGKFEEQKFEEVNEFRGQTAYPGMLQGMVKIINSAEEMKKFKAGEIVVSSATNPNLMPVLRKCAGIVTDEGGITCHAAIVSRELKIPCVIGTNVATKILKDNYLVQMDATHGVVKILKKGD